MEYRPLPLFLAFLLRSCSLPGHRPSTLQPGRPHLCPVSSSHGSPFFTEPSLESLPAARAPKHLDPVSSRTVLGFTSTLPAAPDSSWFPEHSILWFCFCPCGFPCHTPVSFEDLRLNSSDGAAPLPESSPGPPGYCISVVPSNRTCSHTPYGGTLYCWVRFPPVQGRACPSVLT